MRKLLAKMATLGAVFALVGWVASPAYAICGDFDRSFGTYPSSGGTDFYVTSSGMNALDSMQGFFWVLGQGPARNSGNYKFDGTGGSQPWGKLFSGGWTISTTVNNGLTEGCPGPDPTVWVFSDLTADGAGSLFAIVAADQNLMGSVVYDLGKAGNVALRPMPAADVSNATAGAGGLLVDLTWNSDVAFSSGSEAITKTSQVISGWNVYATEVPAGAAAPGSREISDWTKVGTISGAASSSGQITVACQNPSNEVFLAMAPDFDNGFTSTAYVGASSRRLSCGGGEERRQMKSR